MSYESFRNIIYKLDPEDAHKLVENSFKMSQSLPGALTLLSKEFCFENEILSQEIFSYNFKNPVGLAAGFDRNATITKALSHMGFSFIDVGTITKDYQEGSKKPRIHRFVEEESIQNTIGGYNDGCEMIFERFKEFFPLNDAIVSANMAKTNSADAKKAFEELEYMINKFSDYCNLFTFNIPTPSSDLKNSNELKFALNLLKIAKDNTKKAIIFKLMADIDDKVASNYCKILIDNGADGFIISNASTDQSLLKNPIAGGISGKAIKEKSKRLFKNAAKELFGKTILISSGGIDNAQDAYDRIKSGASLIQLYSAFIFKGPFIAKNINTELAKLLEEDGFKNIKDAIGVEI